MQLEESNWDDIERQHEQALNWVCNRGVSSDNIPGDDLRDLVSAVEERDVEAVRELTKAIYDKKPDMHPTAGDIIGGHMAQAYYAATDYETSVWDA